MLKAELAMAEHARTLERPRQEPNPCHGPWKVRF
jgi:hypothetical protein